MKSGPTRPPSLASLPNIGSEIARLLETAGIRTPGALRRLGAVSAALRIRDIRPQDPPCRSLLSGLEGAIRGVCWHSIPKAAREILWEKYQQRLGPNSP